MATTELFNNYCPPVLKTNSASPLAEAGC